MPLVSKIDHLKAHVVDFPLGHSTIAIAAVGEVPTTGWTHPRLSPRFYIAPPADGVWDFDFVADAPTGIVAEVFTPLAGAFVSAAPDWCRGVRVHAATNKLEQELQMGATAARAPGPTLEALMQPAGRATTTQRIASYDDSIQPTGTIHWHNDGPFGLPTPHVEMKKLHHDLVLSIDGPDADKIRDCLNRAIAAGVVAAIAAAIATGGLALQAAISAALAELQGCLGDGFSVRIDDQSHWEYWDT